MTYEAWRCTFQSAEQAALAAYSKVEELTQRVAELEAERAEREKQKPVAWVHAPKKKPALKTLSFSAEPTRLQKAVGFVSSPLYTAPPITSPVRLTNQDFDRMYNEAGFEPNEMREAAEHMFDAIQSAVLRANGFTSDHPARPLELVGLRGCNSLHGGAREPDPCIYRMRTTDPGCTGCAERDEDQAAEAGG